MLDSPDLEDQGYKDDNIFFTLGSQSFCCHIPKILNNIYQDSCVTLEVLKTDICENIIGTSAFKNSEF